MQEVLIVIVAVVVMVIWLRMHRRRGEIRRGAKCRGCFYLTTANAHPCRICKRIVRDMPFDHYVVRMK